MENYLYPFFWQHGEAHKTLSEYMEKISGCGMKGVCIEARPHPGFLSEGWWMDMDLILGKAKELGMKLWILDDSHFPTGFANGRIKESYPQYLKWYLAMRRYDVQGPMRGARIDFSLLKGRPWEKSHAEDKVLGVYLAGRAGKRTAPGDPIDESTLVDITAQMRMDERLLTLDVPDGAFSVFVVYMTRSGGEEATKDYLNPLVGAAAEVLIKEVYEPHYARYKEEFGKTIQGFFSDEPRFGNIKGTEGGIGRPDMVLPWRAGLEEELCFERKYLPLLWVNGGGEESTVRYRYMDMVTRLYNENFTKVLGDWCREHGVWYLGHTIEDNGAHARLGYGTGHYFRGQQDMDFAGVDVIGGQIVPGMNYHHDAFSTGGSEGEFYHYALAKLASSAAHLDPKKGGRCMCEAFGAYGWNEGLKMMKWIADHLLARGVNYLVPHAFDPKEFPDFDCPPHFYAHGHNPQFRYFSVFSDYVNRIAGLFREGSYPARVGVLYPAELEWTGACMPVEKPAGELTKRQISFDIVTIDYLKTAALAPGTYTINGEEFEVLVIPYGECLPAELFLALERLRGAGVRIIWLEKLPERLTEMGAGGKIPDALFHIGEVTPLKRLGSALSSYAAFRLQKPQPSLVAGEYVRDGIKFCMVFNEHIGAAIHTRLTLKDEGFAYWYDAFQNRLYELAEKGEKGTELSLDLEPYESGIIVISGRKLPAGEREARDGWTEAPLHMDWQVRYADSFSYPEFGETLPVRRLCCVEGLAGFERKAGTVRFEAEIALEPCRAAELKLGEAYETAEVFVDGVSAGVRICRPYRFDLSNLICKGEHKVSVHKIAIEVTNTLGTAVRDAISHYLTIEPFGIRGPVELRIKKE